MVIKCIGRFHANKSLVPVVRNVGHLSAGICSRVPNGGHFTARFFYPNPAAKSIVTNQHLHSPTAPFGFSYHPAYVQVYTENVWGKAISRVVTEKWSDEQAVDEAVTRIQTIFRAWK